MKILVAPGRQQRSRSRERARVHVPPSAGEKSAAVESKGRVSDRSRSPQRKESPQRQKGKKTTAEVKKPNDLPKAKKHKPIDSDGGDEEPQNELGNSSNTQPIVPVLNLQQGPAARSQGPSTSTTSTRSQGHRPVPTLRMNTLTTMTSTEKDNLAHQYRVHGVMILQGQCSNPDLHVLTNDEHWTMTPEAHKYAAAAGSFCVVAAENGEQQDLYNVTTVP